MVLLGDVGQVEPRFGLFGDSTNLSTTLVHTFTQNVAWAWMSFWAHPITLLGDVCHVEAYFGSFGDSVNLRARLVHGLRRVHTGMEIFSGTHDGTSR
jgi:hypothetical protein